MNVEVIPFLSMNGDAAKAIAFYEKYLEANILFKKSYREMKQMNPHFSYEEGQDEFITHSVLQIGSNKIMIAEKEMDPTRPWQLGNSSSFCIQSRDTEAIKNLYESIISHEKVTVLMPFEKNAFSPGYAVIRDPFGIVIQLCVTVHDF